MHGKDVFILQKIKNVKMNQNSVMIPVGTWSQKRLTNLSAAALIRDKSKTGSGFGKNISNWIDPKKSIPIKCIALGDRMHQSWS